MKLPARFVFTFAALAVSAGMAVLGPDSSTSLPRACAQDYYQNRAKLGTDHTSSPIGTSFGSSPMGANYHGPIGASYSTSLGSNYSQPLASTYTPWRENHHGGFPGADGADPGPSVSGYDSAPPAVSARTSGPFVRNYGSSPFDAYRVVPAYDLPFAGSYYPGSSNKPVHAASYYKTSGAASAPEDVRNPYGLLERYSSGSDYSPWRKEDVDPLHMRF